MDTHPRGVHPGYFIGMRIALAEDFVGEWDTGISEKFTESKVNMDLSFKLISFGEYKNWQPEEVAKEHGLSPESYKDLEKGRAKLNGIPAQKLPDLYQAPIAFFL